MNSEKNNLPPAPFSPKLLWINAAAIFVTVNY